MSDLPFDNETLAEIVSVITANGYQQEWNDLIDRIKELEASDRGRVQYIRKLEGQAVELQRKHSELVEEKSAILERLESNVADHKMNMACGIQEAQLMSCQLVINNLQSIIQEYGDD